MAIIMSFCMACRAMTSRQAGGLPFVVRLFRVGARVDDTAIRAFTKPNHAGMCQAR
jgi:hypothetical protein